MTKRTHCGKRDEGLINDGGIDIGHALTRETVIEKRAEVQEGLVMTPMVLLRRLYINETGRGAGLGQDTVTPTTTTTDIVDVVAIVIMHLAKEDVTVVDHYPLDGAHVLAQRRGRLIVVVASVSHDPRYFQTTMTIFWTVDHNRNAECVVYRLLRKME